MPLRIGTLQEGQKGKSFKLIQSVLKTSFALRIEDKRQDMAFELSFLCLSLCKVYFKEKLFFYFFIRFRPFINF